MPAGRLPDLAVHARSAARSWKALHRWPGAISAFILLLFAVSGILLNQREAIAPYAVSRRALPAGYRFENWNLAAVRGAVEIDGASWLYGDIGIWRSEDQMRTFTPVHAGLPRGMGQRKIFHLLHTPAGHLYAATFSGLYTWREGRWQAVALPVPDRTVRTVRAVDGDLYVLTRSHLLRGRDDPAAPLLRVVPLAPAEDHDGRVSLFRTLWVIHSGAIGGWAGKRLVDLMGLLLAFLTLTGLVWFLAPGTMRRLKAHRASRARLGRVNRFAMVWHRRLGIIATPFLLVITVTGMFLRPPFLLTILNTDLPAPRYTILNHPNPWHDTLRDLQYDRLGKRFILSTSRGFYTLDPSLAGPVRPLRPAPPVSVMGINVFEQPADGYFLVGSFSGMYRWVPSAGLVLDKLTNQPVPEVSGMARPFSALPVSGYMNDPEGRKVLFLYDAGALTINRRDPFPPMSQAIKDHSPMPLWNLALEVHTGRIYAPLLKQGYILVVPLAGLTLLLILLSAVILWSRRRLRRNRAQRPL